MVKVCLGRIVELDLRLTQTLVLLRLPLQELLLQLVMQKSTASSLGANVGLQQEYLVRQ